MVNEIMNLAKFNSDFIHDDITFCLDECSRIDCFRNKENIILKEFPHSFSSFENTPICPFYSVVEDVTTNILEEK